MLFIIAKLNIVVDFWIFTIKDINTMKESVFTNYINTIYGAGSSMPIFDKHTSIQDDVPIYDAFSDSESEDDKDIQSDSDNEEDQKDMESKKQNDSDSEDIIETYGEPIPVSTKKSTYFDKIKALSINATYSEEKGPIVESVELIEEYVEPKKETKGSGKTKFNGGMNDKEVASLIKSYM